MKLWFTAVVLVYFIFFKFNEENVRTKYKDFNSTILLLSSSLGTNIIHAIFFGTNNNNK